MASDQDRFATQAEERWTDNPIPDPGRPAG
jgi:hypothetical protein